MPYLSMTRLKLKSVIYLLPFGIQNEQVIRQIRTSHGFLKGKELAALDLSMWTATLWDSQESIKAFYFSSFHKDAMKNISVWASEAVTARREIDSFQELPSWEEIRNELMKAGHFTPLQDTSSAHNTKIITKPSPILLTRLLSPN